MKKLYLILLLFFLVGEIIAQDSNPASTSGGTPNAGFLQETYKPSETQFMIRGYGHVGYESITTNGETSSTFNGGSFSPIFLFKHSDRLMFETELEFEINEGSLEVGFEYADVMYVLNKYMTVRAGKFLLPFGTFMERMHPSWINRFSTKPLGFGHDGITPGSGVGVELRGAFKAGASTFNYSLYSTNGPSLKTPDGAEPMEAGMLSFGNLRDNNKGKAVGGRIGFLPFVNSSTELGFSFYSTKKLGDMGSDYENLGANLYAFDFSFVKQLPAISGIIDVKSQYNKSKVDHFVYLVEEEPGVFEDLDYINDSNSFYAQLSYRPSMAESGFVKNLEFVGRYSELTTPEGSGWETNKKEYSLGLNYWLSWRSVVKLSYQNITGTGGHDVVGTFEQNAVYLHWAIGF